jgi:hypothetical protein
MKSRKIKRLEFLLDKIEGGDSKRKVMLTHFAHPMKKSKLGWDSPWEGSHGRSWSSMEAPWGLAREGEGGRGEGHGWGCSLGRGRHGNERRSSTLLLRLLPICGGAPAFCTWEKAGRRKEKGEEKEKEGKEKKNMENFPNLIFFEK